MKNQNGKNQAGFTLIELLIALTILSIVLAIAVPQYRNYVLRAQVAEAVAAGQGLVPDILEYKTFTETLPTALVDVGIGNASDLETRFVETVSIDGADVIVTMGNDAAGPLQGATLALYAYQNGAGHVQYLCSTVGAPGTMVRAGTSLIGTSIPTAQLPQDCR